MSKLHDAIGSVRDTVQETWSEHRKLVIAIGSSVVAFGVLLTGLRVMWLNTPPKLPTTIDQAVSVMNSSRYRNLDNDRKLQYAEAATRLMRDLTDEERRALFDNKEARDAIHAAFREQMDEMVKRVARGESLDDIMQGMPFGPGRGRPGGPPDGRRSADGANRDGPPGGPPNGGRDGAGDGGQNRAERFANRIGGMIQTGNAQMNALRGEMMQRRRAEREASGRD